jgi:hypothetical protein
MLAWFSVHGLVTMRKNKTSMGRVVGLPDDSQLGEIMSLSVSSSFLSLVQEDGCSRLRDEEQLLRLRLLIRRDEEDGKDAEKDSVGDIPSSWSFSLPKDPAMAKAASRTVVRWMICSSRVLG